LIFWTWETLLWGGFVFGHEKLVGVTRLSENG
jgi:hypothetical protein